ncbi:MAG: succinate dehydrogenase, hydrophobic membrane anchor protein [Gammaproteobacteria bacterium RIFCSPHIGHO2_12_FULL_41_15]|nr:MAG: succinate dehydrogenase, hydrophobic membrane anchor protein [Gammaproteobacteria bacterium RIFCSPHIGHO2_12_FULL_41_15]
MVNSVTNLSRNGLSDWLIQRVSAVIIGIYLVFIVGYLLGHTIGTRPITYQVWHHLYQSEIMKIATIMVVLSVAAHTWIGMWTVFTDYIKATWLRLILQISLVVLLLGYVVWCFGILWG